MLNIFLIEETILPLYTGNKFMGVLQTPIRLVVMDRIVLVRDSTINQLFLFTRRGCFPQYQKDYEKSHLQWQ